MCISTVLQVWFNCETLACPSLRKSKIAGKVKSDETRYLVTPTQSFKKGKTPSQRWMEDYNTGILLGKVSNGKNFEEEDSVSSTNALINDNVLHSTGSLVNKNVQELLKDVRITSVSNPTYYTIESDEFTYGKISDKEDGTITQIFKARNQSDELPSDNKYDPVLQMLYNRIQVFLIRNNFSLDFLMIFQSYIEYLSCSGVDPLQDRYLLTLQNELSKGFEFTSVIEEILTAFLTKPENAAMKLAFFEHKHKRLTLKRLFTNWKLKHKMNSSLRRLQLVWEHYLMKKCIYIWKQKFEMVSFDYRRESEQFDMFRLESLVFDRWSSAAASQNTKNALADNFFLDRFFQKIRVRYRNIQKNEKLATSFKRKVLLRDSMRQWKLKQAENRVKPFVDTFVKKLAFQRISLRVHRIAEMTNRADFARKNFLLQPVISKWMVSLSIVGCKEKQLIDLEKFFIKGKAFKRIEMALKRRKSEGVLRETTGDTLLKFFFKEIWLRRLLERRNMHEAFATRTSFLLRKYLVFWKKAFFMKLRAEELFDTKLKTEFFKTLKLQSTAAGYKNVKSKIVMRHTLQEWHRKAELCMRYKEFERQIVEKLWYQVFKGTYNIVGSMENQSDTFYESLLMKRYFSAWRNRRVLVQNLDQKVDIFLKLRTVLRVKKNVIHIREVNIKAEAVGSVIYKTGYLRKYLNIWHSNLQVRIGLKLRIAYDLYKKDKAIQNLRKHFYLWKSKYKVYDVNYRSIADKKYLRSSGGRFFDQLLNKIQVYEQWERLSEELRKKSILVSAYSSWKMQQANIEDMVERAQDKIEEKNLLLLLRCLNRWTMKHLKCKRNNETVELFQTRWNRATLRAIILLWRDKVGHSPGKLDYNRALFTDMENGDELEQDLLTPTRIKGTRHITIPGSERIKRSRMEAMKNHYRRARRAIPSPIKTSDTLEALDSPIKRRLAFNVEVKPEGLAQEVSEEYLPPPKISLEKVNRNFASRKNSLDFNRIPDVKFDLSKEPSSESSSSSFVVDRSTLSADVSLLDDSPTRLT